MMLYVVEQQNISNHTYYKLNDKIASCNICKIFDFFLKNIPIGLESDIQRYVIFLLFILMLIFLLIWDYMIMDILLNLVT